MYDPIEVSVQTKNFRDGKYILTDVSDSPAWGEVKAVEEHRKHSGELLGTVNHRKTFVEAAIELQKMANKEQPVSGPRECSGHVWETDPASHGLIDICIYCGEERA